MICPFSMQDLERVAQIWLDSNLQAHSFVPKTYWEGNLEAVKQMLPQAMLYVYKQDGMIQGFIGLTDDYIEGIFVDERARSHGIGKQLLDFVKQNRSQLTLQVYCKNERACRFYQREGFFIKAQQLDEQTGEPEFLMRWTR